MLLTPPVSMPGHQAWRIVLTRHSTASGSMFTGQLLTRYRRSRQRARSTPCSVLRSWPPTPWRSVRKSPPIPDADPVGATRSMKINNLWRIIFESMGLSIFYNQMIHSKLNSLEGNPLRCGDSGSYGNRVANMTFNCSNLDITRILEYFGDLAGFIGKEPTTLRRQPLLL